MILAVESCPESAWTRAPGRRARARLPRRPSSRVDRLRMEIRCVGTCSVSRAYRIVDARRGNRVRGGTRKVASLETTVRGRLRRVAVGELDENSDEVPCRRRRRGAALASERGRRGTSWIETDTFERIRVDGGPLGLRIGSRSAVRTRSQCQILLFSSSASSLAGWIWG